MSDLIDRQALCDDLREYKVHPVPISSDESEVKGYNDGIDLAISVIAEFPSTEPERKKGKWIEYPECLGYDGAYSDDHIVCSECEHVFSILDNCTEEFDFCPHCGAELRGDNETDK